MRKPIQFAIENLKKIFRGERGQYIAILVGAFLGILAVGLVNSHVSRIKAQAMKGLNPVEVVVAKEKVSAGEILNKDKITLKKIPRSAVSVGMVREVDVDTILGRTISISLEKGDPILWNAIGVDRVGPKTFASRLEVGKRAVTIPVDSISSTAGLIKPGDRVDVFGTFSIGGISRTQLLFQNITVLAVSNSISPETAPSSYSNLTLLVTPQQAEFLIYAMERGKLFFLPRNPEDTKEVKLEAIDFSKFSEELEKLR